MNNNVTVLHLYNNSSSYTALLSARDTMYACEAMDSITIVIPDYASINEDLMSDINIYPLPAKSNLYIKSLKLIQQLEIYNIEGKLMMSMMPNSDFVQINVSILPRGTYIIKTLTSDGIYAKQIILQ